MFVTKSTTTETYLGDGCSFGGIDYEEERTNKKVVMIKFGNYLVPIWHVTGPLTYLDLTSKISGNKGALDNRFLTTRPNGNAGERFVKDVKPLFNDCNGKVTLDALIAQQKIHAKHDNEYAPTI